MLGKRLINSNSAATPSGACTTDTLQILGDTSCIAYYKMSDATDESGSYDGTPTSVNFNVAGKFGNAASWNGTNSFMSVPISFNTNAAYSISFWAKLGVGSNDHCYFWQIASGGTSQTALQLAPDNYGTNNLFRFYFNHQGVTNSGTSSIPTFTPTGGWQHFVGTFDGSSLGNLYVDGVNVQSNFALSPKANVDTNLLVGGNLIYGGSTQYKILTGLDQIRIFNKALSSTEVTTLYNEVYCVPTIVPTEHFTPISYTGNGGTQSTNSLNSQAGSLDFSPGLVWIKSRTNAYDHNLYDTVRGADGQGGATDKVLATNKSNAQEQGLGDVTITGSGFTVTETTGSSSSSEVNLNNANYIAWNWYAPTAESIGASGSRIASTVKKNVDAGFSIVSYAGASNATADTSNNSGAYWSVGHGLGATPDLVIVKKTSGAGGWYVGGAALGSTGSNGNHLVLNSSATQVGEANILWGGSQTFNDTTFGLGGWDVVNRNGDSYIAYCFASVDGMSRVGSYVGTSASNTVVTNFRPAFLMIKNTTGGSSWVIFDNKRNPSNPKEDALFPNLSSAEYTFSNTGINFLSNGFSLISNPGETNLNNNTYIFLAIAEEVFNPSGVTRNATNPFGDASELALYKFEDNATDSEGNNNGTESNVTYATGYIDKAAVFNGTTSRIGLGTNTFNSLTSFSFSCWVNLNNAPTGYEYLFDGWDYQNSSRGLIVRITPSANIQANTGFSNSVTNITSSETITHGVWTHIAVSITQTNTTISINGNIESPQSNGGFDFHTGTTYNLGAFTYTNSIYEYFLDGKLDQVRIFNRALDSGEITQLYNE
jgi:hypothetical protein